jgi:hypothetical protein
MCPFMAMKKKREGKNNTGNKMEEVKENDSENSDAGSDDSDYLEPPTKRRRGGCPFMQDGF